jgi:hypothetical protein
VSLQTRLAKLEVSLQAAALGYRFFYSVDDGEHFAETTQPGGHFDYRSALTGADGQWGPGAELMTRDNLNEIEVAGWVAIVIVYGAWPPAGYGPLGSDSTAAEVAEPEPVQEILQDLTKSLPPAPAEVAPQPVAEVSALERARRDLEARLLSEALTEYG